MHTYAFLVATSICRHHQHIQDLFIVAQTVSNRGVQFAAEQLGKEVPAGYLTVHYVQLGISAAVIVMWICMVCNQTKTFAVVAWCGLSMNAPCSNIAIARRLSIPSHYEQYNIISTSELSSKWYKSHSSTQYTEMSLTPQ